MIFYVLYESFSRYQDTSTGRMNSNCEIHAKRRDIFFTINPSVPLLRRQEITRKYQPTHEF